MNDIDARIVDALEGPLCRATGDWQVAASYLGPIIARALLTALEHEHETDAWRDFHGTESVDVFLRELSSD